MEDINNNVILEDVAVTGNPSNIVNQAHLMGAIDKILVKKSIARRVSDIQPLNAPVGIVTGAEWDKTTGKLTLAKADVEATTKKIRTEFTQEALQDLQAIYGESFYDILAHYLVDELAYKIDADFITMVRDRANPIADISFPGVTYDENLLSLGRAIAIKVSKGLADLPISDNRAPVGWAIVSSDVASALGLTTNVNENVEMVDGENEADRSPSYLGRLNGVDYYIDYTNPNDGTNSVVFGIKGNGISKGSTIYCPYRKDWMEAIDSETGQNAYFLMQRSAMVINPLDEKFYNAGVGESAFLGKFNVDLSTMAIFA